MACNRFSLWLCILVMVFVSWISSGCQKLASLLPTSPPPATTNPTYTALPTRTARHTITPVPVLSVTPRPALSPTLAFSPTPAMMPVIEVARWGTSEIKAVAWSPNGQYLAVATSGEVYLFDPETWELLRWVDSTPETAKYLEFSPDSTRLIMVSDGHILRVFTTPSLELLISWQIGYLYIDASVKELSFSPDSSLLIYQSNSAVVWRLSDGNVLIQGKDLTISPDGSFYLQDGVLTQMADRRSLYRVYGSGACFSSDSQLLAVSPYSNNGERIDILQVSDGSLLYSLTLGDEYIEDFRFLADDSVLLVHLREDIVQLWRLADQQQLLELNNDYDMLSPDGSLLVTWALGDSNIHLYATATGNRLFSVQLDYSHVDDIYFSPDSALLVATGDTTQVWNMSSGRLVSTLEEEEYSSNGPLAFSYPPAGSDLPTQLAGSSEGSLLIWDVNSGSLVKALTQNPGRIEQLAFTSDNQHLIFFADTEIIGSIPLEKIESALYYQPYITIDHSQEEQGSYRFYNHVISPDGNAVAYIENWEWVIASVKDGNEIIRLESRNTPFGYSTDGRIVFYQDYYDDFILVRLEDGEIVRRMQPPQGVSDYPDKILLSALGQYFVFMDTDEQGMLNIQVVETAFGRILYTLNGLDGRPHTATLSRDGKFLAISSRQGPIHLFDLKDGSLIWTLEETHGDDPLVISDDSQYLVYAVANEIHLWRITDGKLLAKLYTGSSIASLAFSHDERYLASGTMDGLIRLWDLRPSPDDMPTATATAIPSPTPTSTFPPTPSPQPFRSDLVYSGTPFPQSSQVIRPENASGLSLFGQMGYGVPRAAAWSPDGQHLTILSGSGLKMYTTKPLSVTGWVETGMRVEALVYSPDGSILALAAGDVVMRYQVGEERWLSPLTAEELGHKTLVHIAYSQDGKYIIGQTDGGLIAVWDVQRDTLLRTLDTGQSARGLGISSDAGVIASYSSENHLMLFRLDNGSLLDDLVIPGKEYGAFALSNDLTYMAIVAEDESARLLKLNIDQETGARLEELLSVDLDTDRLYSLAISSDGRYFAIGTREETVSIWDIEAGNKVQELDLSAIPSIYSVIAFKLYFAPAADGLFALTDNGLPILCDLSGQEVHEVPEGFHRDLWNGSLVFTPDGRQIVLGQRDGLIFYSTADGSQAQYLPESIEQVELLNDGSIVTLDTYTTSRDDNSYVELYRLEGNELIYAWEVPIESRSGHQTALAISPDDRYVVTANDTGILRLLQASDGTILDETAAHESHVWSLVFSPDSSLLASSSSESARLWRVQDEQLIPVTTVNLGSYGSLAFSPDSQVMAVETYKDIQFISIADMSPVSLIPGAGNVDLLLFSPDGRMLIGADSSGTIRLWDVATGAGLTGLLGHIYPIVDLKFSPDGKTLASLSTDGTLRIWGIFPDE